MAANPKNTSNNKTNDDYLDFYIQQSSLDLNSIYKKSQNAVKLLPAISNDNGKIKLYTELDSCIDIGDKVFIMYNQHIDINWLEISGLQNSTGKTFILSSEIPDGATVFFTINDSGQTIGTDYNIDKTTLTMVSYAPFVDDVLKINYQFVPDIILDNYLEFSGCTSLNSPYLNNWQYLIQTQGYEVVNINESHNEITINRYFNSKQADKKIYNHYIGKIYVKEIDVTRGEIDGAMINKIFLNTGATTSIDINLVQSVILSGVSDFVHFKNKYDKDYISLNSMDTINPATSSEYNPYTYSGSFISDLDKSPNASYYSRNNNNYGYNYTYNTLINDNIIESGHFENCIITDCEIYDGKFTNCQIISGNTYYGYFIDCNITESVWIDGIWENRTDSAESFKPRYNIWTNGIWQFGVFSGKTWMNGTFNNGTFIDSVWKNGTFYGGQMSSNSITYKKWEKGIFIGGTIKNMDWIDGTFNGISVDAAKMSNCNWKRGTFNGGSAKSIIWETGTFNGGLIELSDWKTGIFNGGIFQNSTWNDGTFNGGTFNNHNNISFGSNSMGSYTSEANLYMENQNYVWYGGTFNDGNFVSSGWKTGIFNGGNFNQGSLWEDGIFNNGNFTNSYWMNGNFNNGIVKDSSFHSVEWKTGVFHSGNMGIRTIGSDPIVNWSGGTFNSGIFGQNIYQWRLETGNLTGDTTLLNTKKLSGTTLIWLSGSFYGDYFFSYYYSRNARISTVSSSNSVTMLSPVGITYYSSGDTITNSISIHDGTKIDVVGTNSFTITENAYATLDNTCTVTTSYDNNGFYGGTFYGGKFYGTFYGGNWVDGTFVDSSINTTTTTTETLESPNEGPSEAIIKKSSRKYGSQSTSSGLHHRRR